MKKQPLIYGIIILVVVAMVIGGYWYWQNQTGTFSLQTVALDNPDIDSFDDVCTKKTDYELECTGNIEEFGCYRYRIDPRTSFSALQPSYPILVCDKKNVPDEGVYHFQGEGLTQDTVISAGYIVIEDNSFQLIKSEDQYREMFQPIESVEEANDYFVGLHRAFLALNDNQLSKITSLAGGDNSRFYVPVDTIVLSSINATTDGFHLIAYSNFSDLCIDEMYQYQYLLRRDGLLVEKSQQLIWESEVKPSCVH